MNTFLRLCLCTAAIFTAGGAVHAADAPDSESTTSNPIKPRFSWFSGESDSPLSYQYDPQGRRLFADFAPNQPTLSDTLQRYSFGASARQPLLADTFVFGDVLGWHTPLPTGDHNTVNVIAGGGFRFGQDQFRLPLAHQELLSDRQRARTFDALGLEWRHALDPGNSVTVAAQRGGYTDWTLRAAGTDSTQALVAWTSELGGLVRPQITGSVFLGDEAAKDETYRYLGRRYYGVALEGRVSLFSHHTPYTSVQLRHSDYNANDPVFLVPRREDYARLAAGWNWRISSNWGIRAEANYSLNSSTIESYQYDQRQVFLTTRFDFR
jgi:hypothetical protein